MTTPTYAAGKYSAQVLDQGFIKSNLKKTLGLFLQLRILGIYDDKGEVNDCPQFERTCTQWLAGEAGVEILKRYLESLGEDLTDFGQLVAGSPTHINLVGRTLTVSCEIEVYNGVEREKWSLSRPQHKKLDLSSVQELTKRFGHLLNGQQPKPGIADDRFDNV